MLDRFRWWLIERIAGTDTVVLNADLVPGELSLRRRALIANSSLADVEVYLAPNKTEKAFVHGVIFGSASDGKGSKT